MPGFVSSAVLNAIVVRQTKSRISHVIIEALVFSFLIYACLAPFFGGSPVSVEVRTGEDRTTYQPIADPEFLISAMGLAIRCRGSTTPRGRRGNHAGKKTAAHRLMHTRSSRTGGRRLRISLLRGGAPIGAEPGR